MARGTAGSGRRLAVLAGGLGMFVAGGLVLAVALVAVVVLFSGGSDQAPTAAPDGDCDRPAPAVPVLDSGPRVATLTAEQTGNARTIVQVASSLSASQGLSADLTRRAAVIGIMTAMQESTLRNLHYGDRDSLGLFQQRNAWASASERTTPSAAARMFYTGGHGGQRGLFDIPGWSSRPLWAAAQAVQVSAFPTAYARWERTARATVAALLGGVVPAAAVAPAPSAGLDLGRAACEDPEDTPAQPAASTKGWVLPLPRGSFTPTSPFGYRVHPTLHEWKLHTGQDLGAPQGTPIYAAAAGRVTTAGLNGTAGNQIILDHPGGVQSVYDHLSVIGVPVGAQVRAGQLLGRVGNTGRSTGAHLHFEIRRHGQPIDPVPFLRARGVNLTRTPA
jgi:murein DD-endopeptidase MepM/ murein hydrolase activator NlpD